MALGMTICLLALMGMPPTAGFFGKLFVFRAAFENDNPVLRWLVVAALINSVIGAYYYLRLIVSMYFRPPPEREMPTLPGRGARVVVGLAAALSLAFGIFANPLMRRAHLGAAGFAFPPGVEDRGEWVDRLRAKWEQEDTETVEQPPPPADAEDPTDEGTPAAVDEDQGETAEAGKPAAAGADGPKAAQ
jgi:formate hydrogenlyase subunit 3/multisubunit Na+/H+ antiporter MnhD subunit